MTSTLEMVLQFLTALREQFPTLDNDARVCMLTESVKAELEKVGWKVTEKFEDDKFKVPFLNSIGNLEVGEHGKVYFTTCEDGLVAWTKKGILHRSWTDILDGLDEAIYTMKGLCSACQGRGYFEEMYAEFVDDPTPQCNKCKGSGRSHPATGRLVCRNGDVIEVDMYNPDLYVELKARKEAGMLPRLHTGHDGCVANTDVTSSRMRRSPPLPPRKEPGGEPLTPGVAGPPPHVGCR